MSPSPAPPVTDTDQLRRHQLALLQYFQELMAWPIGEITGGAGIPPELAGKLYLIATDISIEELTRRLGLTFEQIATALDTWHRGVGQEFPLVWVSRLPIPGSYRASCVVTLSQRKAIT
jgi:hypothetical protein